MKITYIAKTKTGRFSIDFTVICIFLVFLINMFKSLGFSAAAGKILYPILAVGAFLSVIGSLAFGIKALTREKERSVLMFFCLIFDLLSLYFAIAQMIGFFTGSPS